MPNFKLGEYSVELAIEPLTGPLAQVDRQVAWQLYVDLVARPVLRADTATAAELGELLAAWRALLALWPAAHLDTPSADQLGAVMLTVIEMMVVSWPRGWRGRPGPHRTLGRRRRCRCS